MSTHVVWFSTHTHTHILLASFRNLIRGGRDIAPITLAVYCQYQEYDSGDLHNLWSQKSEVCKTDVHAVVMAAVRKMLVEISSRPAHVGHTVQRGVLLKCGGWTSGWCLEDDFVQRCFLVSGPGNDVLVIGRDVTAQHWWWLLWLHNTPDLLIHHSVCSQSYDLFTPVRDLPMWSSV